MSEMLEKARKYEFIQGQQIKEEERPAFHITPYVGWMNDPMDFPIIKESIICSTSIIRIAHIGTVCTGDM